MKARYEITPKELTAAILLWLGEAHSIEYQIGSAEIWFKSEEGAPEEPCNVIIDIDTKEHA
jgi:hypothetical protein